MLLDGRIFASGNNVGGRCGVGSDKPWIATPVRVRLPRVIDGWCGHGSWYIRTTHGFFAWGNNVSGRLGVGKKQRTVTHPAALALPRSGPERVVPVGVWPFDRMTFIQTEAGWYGSGDNRHNAMGVGPHLRELTSPRPVLDCRSVTRWYSSQASTFGWTGTGLVAMGDNSLGQLGTAEGDTGHGLRHVMLPHDIAVESVVTHSGSTFIRSRDACFGVGRNLDLIGSTSQLGFSTKTNISVPQPVPFAVDHVTTYEGSTIMLSSGQLIVCGVNHDRQLAPAGQSLPPIPMPIDWAAQTVVQTSGAVFARHEDGGWFARGWNSVGQLGVGVGVGTDGTDGRVGEWTRVRLSGIQAILRGDNVATTFFICHDGLYAAGDNSRGLLGVESSDPRIPTPQPVVRQPAVALDRPPRIDLPESVTMPLT